MAIHYDHETRVVVDSSDGLYTAEEIQQMKFPCPGCEYPVTPRLINGGSLATSSGEPRRFKVGPRFRCPFGHHNFDSL